MSSPVYALNLFNVSHREEYLAYSRRSAKEVTSHGGRVVALGKFREAAVGEIVPRSVLILVEWESKEAFDSYCNDPLLADLHPHRRNGTTDYIWHLFDKLEDLRPLLKRPELAAQSVELAVEGQQEGQDEKEQQGRGEGQQEGFDEGGELVQVVV